MITSILKRMQPNRPHLAMLVVLLLCAVVLTGFLAQQGYDAQNEQRVQAEHSLRDYATQVADNWHGIVQRYIYNGLYYALDPAVAAAEAHRGARVEGFAAAVNLAPICTCLTPADVRTYFAFDVGGRALEITGQSLSASVAAWITTSLPQTALAGPHPLLAVGTLVGSPDGNHRVVFYGVRTDSLGAPITVYGFETGSEVLARFLDTTWRRASLVIPSISDGMPNDWLFSVTVSDQRGQELYQSGGRYPQQYTARYTLDRILRDMYMTVAVSPDMTDQFLIGGLPSKRLPTLFALLGLTVGLLMVALFLIRREAEITRLRADFIAGVSHELRTPLAQIRMFAETLMLGRVRSEGERHRSLEIIDQEARRLTHLVENVLLFARAERRSSRINPERVDLASDIRDAIHGFAILCRSKAVEIRPELQEGVTVPVDRGALRQILLNLLDNAAKYGPLAQRITVGMALFERAVRVWVDDEGQGIPEDDRARVFESFYRLERDIASPVAGSGIGLSIVRELVSMHDGRAWIDDAPGGGARVVVELPGAYLRPEVAKDEWAVA